jgi:hypothetical protein
MLVMFATTPLDSDTAVTDETTNSPILPACALSFVVVPAIPNVDEIVTKLLALIVVKLAALRVNAPRVALSAPLVDVSEVNAPVPGTVLPIEGGDANNAVNPAPLTAPLADNVVAATVLGVVAPRVPLSAPLVELTAAGAVLPRAGGEANSAVKPAPLTAPVADSVVNAPVLAVVAPIVTPFSVPLVACTADTVGFGYVPDRSPPAGPLGGSVPMRGPSTPASCSIVYWASVGTPATC